LYLPKVQSHKAFLKKVFGGRTSQLYTQISIVTCGRIIGSIHRPLPLLMSCKVPKILGSSGMVAPFLVVILGWANSIGRGSERDKMMT
jgi:hypothetical protein